jgi:L-ectoine synthase
MFVRTLADVEAAGRLKVQWNATVQSARILTADDGMGFSLHENRVTPGEVIAVWYKHHWEANYIISGRGRVEDLGTGESFALEPGILYNVGPKDRHRLSAETAMHLVSVFCPPLAGHEQHDADGSLEPSGPVPAGPPGY